VKTISVAGDGVTILLDGTDTGGSYTALEALIPPDGGPPPHVHAREDEGFLVVSGEVTYFLTRKRLF
jgi:mannose-6-phosphate isomerase-like protein (cupin superfamily)